MGRKERREAKRNITQNGELQDESYQHLIASPEIDFFFADDARQRKPTRAGMGELVAIGGINVPAGSVGEIAQQLDALCASCGFPAGQEFKWSPGRELWMHQNLARNDRLDFFLRVIEILNHHQVVATIIVGDTTFQTATGAKTHELDAVTLFLERVDHQCERDESFGFVIVDRPSGNRGDEDAFLASCLETLQFGTKYVKPSFIVHNVLSAPSHHSRLLQAADLVTGCTLSIVSGETQHAPPVFEAIKSLLDRNGGRIGGYGLKIHPDARYANLYHWLVNDQWFYKAFTFAEMPLPKRKYATGPFKV